jgi:hypothetical protein
MPPPPPTPPPAPPVNDPGRQEYKRFAEDPEYLAMNNLQNQIDFSPVRPGERAASER